MDTSELSRSLGTALRDVMTQHGITLDQVAAVLGRSRGYVSERTTGARELSLDIVVAVARLTHLTEHAVMVEVTERARLTG